MRALKLTALAILVLCTVTVGGNWAALDRRVQAALAEDPRNDHVTLRTYLAWGLNPSVLVLDFRGSDGLHSMADVDRMMLTSLQALKSYSFDKVVFAFQGSYKLQMPGSYARQLGEEYGYQNVLNTMRTMQEHIFRLDGSPAFGTWEGGWLSVMGKQMEDHNRFHQLWCLASAE